MLFDDDADEVWFSFGKIKNKNRCKNMVYGFGGAFKN
jgi:hypothetical protein